MYKVVSSKTFVDMVGQCSPLCIADMEIDTGDAELINRRRLLEIVRTSTEIRCYQDDLLERYDIYYREDRDARLARVLMEAG
ncbi:hypothetical protein [[Clostridium] hylemonae]|uniref:hypothetical protein n=1 Tax=[Clostridium] hylemonae TaxID=89153 RepID=UPI0011074828|nr:hypothetical protein [[Clostridium] hylemonae]